MTQDTATPVDFVTFAAENYLDWVKLWLDSASRSNPDSRLLVYDVSREPSEAFRQLVESYPNAMCIPWPETDWRWPEWIDQTTFRSFRPEHNLSEEIKFLAHRLRYRLTGFAKKEWVLDKAQFVQERRYFLKICCQKPHIVRDARQRSDRPLAYVDADALALDPFMGHPCPGTDAAVTVVDPDQIKIGQGEFGPDGPLPVSLINAGVIFFNNTPGASLLLDAWIAEMSRIAHGAADQTALANLLYRSGPGFHEDMRAVSVNFQGGSARVGCLPCHRYNQVRIGRNLNGIDPAAAIVHFVGSWKQPDLWPLVQQLAEAEGQRRGAAR